MIKSMTLENFQSHEHTVLDFHAGVNALVGKSDSGKSAIFRGLKWVIKNRPSGDAYRSHWGGETAVTLELVSGVVIKRVKGDSINAYYIDDKELTGFGQDVPPEVQAALNINDVNLQTQTDIPFLLGNNSGEVARYLNHIVSLDDIDKVVSGINSQHTTAKGLAKAARTAVTNYEEALDKFADLPAIEELVDKAEAAEIKLRVCMEQEAALTTILRTMELAQAKLESSDKTLKHLQAGLEKAEKVRGTYDQANGELDQLEGIIHTIRKLEKRVQNSPYKAKHEELLTRAALKAGSRQKYAEDIAVLQQLLGSIDSHKESIEDAHLDFVAAKTKFDELMPDTCPLCGK